MSSAWEALHLYTRFSKWPVTKSYGIQVFKALPLNNRRLIAAAYLIFYFQLFASDVKVLTRVTL